MQILNEKPPEWIMTGCLSQFRVNVDSTVWTYGDVIYNPGGGELADHIIAHEQMHILQQEAIEGGKDAWWTKFLIDPDFRLEQEAQAYGCQYAFFCGKVKDRNQRFKFLHQLARHLSSPLYQVAIPHSEAMRGIKEIAQAIQA